MTAPAQGPLSTFQGTWSGPGLSLIFRPQNPATPAALPSPVPSPNVLGIAIFQELLTFLTNNIGTVVNRGSEQGDITVYPVMYDQYITDQTVTLPRRQNPVIHQEAGFWTYLPVTTEPESPPVVARQGSLPHGVSFNCQGLVNTQSGPPIIPKIDITPYNVATDEPMPQPSQQASTVNAARIPQDLSSYIKAGTITQAYLDDPNQVLRDAIAKQKITSTTTIDLLADPDDLGNTAFLKANAECVGFAATWYIETVDTTARPALQQIQYTQTIELEFDGTVYPHVTVATLQRQVR